MAWNYGSAVMTPQAATGAGGAARIAEIFALMNSVDSDWATTVTPVAFASGSVRGWGQIGHTSGARLNMANNGTGTGGSTNQIAAAQSYTGAANTTDAGPWVSYMPAGGAYTDPITSTLPADAFLYSQLANQTGTGTTHTTAERWHVWIDGPRVILASQSTAAAAINAVGIFGDFCSALSHPSDTDGMVQWTLTGNLPTPGDTLTGQGQCFSATGTRVIGYTGLAQNYGLVVAAQAGAYVAEPYLFASQVVGATVVANNRRKGYLDPQDILAVPLAIDSKKRLADPGSPTAYTHVALRNGIAVVWDPTWGSMP
jgi:hypothetical protein